MVNKTLSLKPTWNYRAFSKAKITGNPFIGWMAKIGFFTRNSQFKKIHWSYYSIFSFDNTFKASTVIKIINPGNIANHQASIRNLA